MIVYISENNDPMTGQVMLPPGMETEPRTGKKRGRPKKIPMEGELPPLEQGIAQDHK